DATVTGVQTCALPILEIGGRDRARTGDPLLAKQVLSQLSYTPPYNYMILIDFRESDQLLSSSTPANSTTRQCGAAISALATMGEIGRASCRERGESVW